MKIGILPKAEEDLEHAFDHYESQRVGLGKVLIEEFRRAVDQIREHPRAWQAMDETYRRCRLHRFPYGIVYRIETDPEEIIIVSMMHLSQRPGAWRG